MESSRSSSFIADASRCAANKRVCAHHDLAPDLWLTTVNNEGAAPLGRDAREILAHYPARAKFVIPTAWSVPSPTRSTTPHLSLSDSADGFADFHVARRARRAEELAHADLYPIPQPELRIALQSSECSALEFRHGTRKLGRTDLTVSAICLGSMTWGEQNTEAEGHEQLDYALDCGVNFIDTAEIYSIPPRRETQGSTERIIGSWLAARRNRDKVIIATKVAGRGDAHWLREGGARPILDARTSLRDRRLAEAPADRLCRSLSAALAGPLAPALGRGRHDLSAARASATKRRSRKRSRRSAELVKAGKVRHIGLSNETPWGVARFLRAAELGHGPRVVSIQNAYNLLNRSFRDGARRIRRARRRSGLLAYSPLAQGYLTGKYQGGARPARRAHDAVQTRASATRSRASRRRSTLISRSRATSAPIRRSSPSPSSRRGLS